MNACELQCAALAWAAAGRAAVVVEVLAARGSVPRGAGTRMLVAVDAVLSTIGGGHLELQAIADARALLERSAGRIAGHVAGHVAGQLAGHVAGRLAGRLGDHSDDATTFKRHVALGPGLGQCCGGALTLQHTLLADEDPAAWPLPAPRFALQLYGAGHVGRAIVRVLAGVPCSVQWVDERESEFPADALPPHITKVCVEPVEAEVAAAPPGCFFLVLTHSHALDLAITQAILARGDFGFFGLIGSQTKRAKFEARLRERGVSAALLARMVCPIGLPGVEGKEPGVIAVAAVAQLLLTAGQAPEPCIPTR